MTAFTSILSRTAPPTRRDTVRAMFESLRDLEAAYPECNRAFRRDVAREMILPFFDFDDHARILDALIDTCEQTDPQEREAAAERLVSAATTLHRFLEKEAADRNLGEW